MNNEIVFFAFRYALGRKSYAVVVMVDYIIDNWDKIEFSTQTRIKAEIRKAIAFGEAGMDMDVILWEQILELK